MAALTCPRCGAEFESPARFCRRCGNSLGAGEPSIGPSEATTRAFDNPLEQGPAEGNRTAPANQWPTAPAYLGPDQMAVGPQYPAFPGSSTQGLTQKRSKAPFVILGVLGLVLVAVIAAFALIIGRVGRGADRFPGPMAGPNAGAPEAPPGPVPNAPVHPQIPPPPALPEPPGSTEGAVTGPLASLIYPGSHQEMNVEDEDGAKVIKLTTPDPAEKVVDWYAAKLPHSNRVSVPFVGITTISKNGLAVIIKPGKPTNIMLTKGD